MAVTAVMRKCRYLANGMPEFAPTGERTEITLSDFLALAAENQLAAECFDKIVALVIEQGTAQGVL